MKSGLDVFTNPEYRALAKKHQDDFKAAGALADGNQLVAIMKNLLIKQGEWDFEQEIKDHPYGICVPSIGRSDPLSFDLTTWLSDQLDDSDYILMPINVIGKYKDKWNWIYFRNQADAVLFKLSCL